MKTLLFAIQICPWEKDMKEIISSLNGEFLTTSSIFAVISMHIWLFGCIIAIAKDKPMLMKMFLNI